MKLEDTVFWNLSQIPNTPINATSSDVISGIAQRTRFTETQFADRQRLLVKVDNVAQSQLQHDLLTAAAKNFYAKIDDLFRATGGD